MINISFEALFEILSGLFLLAGIYISLNNKNIRHDERLKNLESHCSYLSDDNKILRKEANEYYETLSKIVHENSLVLEGVKTTLKLFLEKEK